jgi:hypothetical protein
VVSPQDVAMYGGLCALATFDRAELKACTQILILLVNGNCETLIILPFWFHFLLFAEQSYRQYCLQEFLGVSAWSKGTYKWFLLKASCCTFFFLFGVISTHHISVFLPKWIENWFIKIQDPPFGGIGLPRLCSLR